MFKNKWATLDIDPTKIQNPNEDLDDPNFELIIREIWEVLKKIENNGRCTVSILFITKETALMQEYIRECLMFYFDNKIAKLISGNIYSLHEELEIELVEDFFSKKMERQSWLE